MLGFFGAMRRFADQLRKDGHRVVYLALDDLGNTHRIPDNLQWTLRATGATNFGHQLPDEYRLDLKLKEFATHREWWQGSALRTALAKTFNPSILAYCPLPRRSIRELKRGASRVPFMQPYCIY